MAEQLVSNAPAPAQAVPDHGRRRELTPRAVAFALVPLALLIGVMIVIFATDGGIGDRTAPPIETLSVQRVQLPEPGQIELEVVNDGPDEITIAQVFVDDAYWQFTQSPPGPLGRLESATIAIPYPWVQDEAHAITMISATCEPSAAGLIQTSAAIRKPADMPRKNFSAQVNSMT